MEELLATFREAQKRVRQAKKDRAVIELDAPGASEEEIAALETRLQLRLPATYRAFLGAFDTKGPAGQMYCFRMDTLSLPGSWDDIVARIAEGSRRVKALLRDRKLLPFADDYGGRHWYCLDFSRSQGGDCPVMELDLDMDFGEEEPACEEVASTFAEFLRDQMERAERELLTSSYVLRFARLKDSVGRTVRVPGLGQRYLGLRLKSVDARRVRLHFVDESGRTVAPDRFGVKTIYDSQELHEADGSRVADIGMGMAGTTEISVSSLWRDRELPLTAELVVTVEVKEAFSPALGSVAAAATQVLSALEAPLPLLFHLDLVRGAKPHPQVQIGIVLPAELVNFFHHDLICEVCTAVMEGLTEKAGREPYISTAFTYYDEDDPFPELMARVSAAAGPRTEECLEMLEQAREEWIRRKAEADLLSWTLG